jgi:protein phosphatase
MSEMETAGLDDVEALERLSDAVVLTGERIADVVAAHPEFAGMGTTLTALAWLGGDPARVAVLHVGDSRAYLLRDDVFTQITRDHTYVQTLIDSGRITPEEALLHPRRNLLMRAIDAVHPAEPDVSVREAHVGDRYLVCSDGLSGYVSDERVHELLGLRDPVAVVTALVDAALAAGAPDNVTCVVADVVQVEEAQAEQAPVVVGAAGEPRNREQLPEYSFPADEQLDPHAAHVVKVRTASGNGSSDVDAIADVYHEEQPQHRRRRRTRVVAVVAVLALVLAGLSAVTWAWARNQFYIANDGGYVAIYRGLPGSIGPLALHSVEETTAVTVDSLPDFEAMQVEGGIPTDSLESAERVVQRLSERAAQCVAVPTTPGCPQTTGTDAGVADSTAGTGTTPTGSASPSVSGP